MSVIYSQLHLMNEVRSLSIDIEFQQISYTALKNISECNLKKYMYMQSKELYTYFYQNYYYNYLWESFKYLDKTETIKY